MTDIFHQWGSDLALGPTGDLATATGTVIGQQRILRRLLTNPGDYIWQLDYGAGLGRFVGSPIAALHIRAVVLSQISREAAVSRHPTPVVEVGMLPAGGGTNVLLRYADAMSDQTQSLNFTVGG